MANIDIQPAPVDCDGEWSEWDSCTTTCGVGTKARTFTVQTPAVHGGTPCRQGTELLSEGSTQTSTCNLGACLVPTPAPVVADDSDEWTALDYIMALFGFFFFVALVLVGIFYKRVQNFLLAKNMWPSFIPVIGDKDKNASAKKDYDFEEMNNPVNDDNDDQLAV